jgi:hypothetical protein
MPSAEEDVRLRPAPPLGDRVLTVQREVSSGGEPDDVGVVEVGHLRAGESAVADVAEAEDGGIESPPVMADCPLVPQHDQVLVVREHDASVRGPRGLGLDLSQVELQAAPWREILPCPSRCPESSEAVTEGEELSSV